MSLSAMYHPTGVEIEGTEDALRQFCRDIERCDGICQLDLAALTETDERGLSYAKTITVQVSDGLVDVAVSNEGIVISGSKKKLNILVANILFLAESRQSSMNNSDHIHVEYFPGDFPFLAPTALPLIVTKQDEP
jgi:hypothetical protein